MTRVSLSTHVGRPDTNTTPIDNVLPRKISVFSFPSYDSSTHLLVNNVFVIFTLFFFIPLRSKCFHPGRRGPLVGHGIVGCKDAYPSH